ncbi:MAG: ABC transporter substrate-binding protein [Methanosarcinales archaeon]|nr:ABC transporter substrate-binding protein [Methanosarcinales archaeon]
MKKRIFVLMGPVLCLLLLIGAAASQPTYPMTIRDSAGRDVVIQEPVERIIVLNSDAAEAVTMLGAADMVVGVVDTITRKADYFPELKDKQVVGKWNEFNYEMIGEIANSEDSVEPNIILICYSYTDKPYGVVAVEQGVEPFENIAVVALDFYKPEKLEDEVAILGQILGKDVEAQDYLNWYWLRSTEVKEAVSGQNIPEVYYERNNKGGLGALDTYGSGSGLIDLQRGAGGYNLARSLEGEYPQVEWEWVVKENPDVIIRMLSASTLGWEAGPSRDTVTLQRTRDEILSRPGAGSISAVKNDRVYVLYWDMCYGMDSVIGQTYLANILHPGLNLDAAGVYQEYLERIGASFPENNMFSFPGA